MIILSIDVASKILSVALLKKEGDSFSVISSQDTFMERGQGEALIPVIDALLKEHNLDIQDVSLICAGVGPGSFTGVRIALATARGLALARAIPVLGFTGFEAYAHNTHQPVLVVLDTKRGDFFTQAFDASGKATEEPKIRTVEELEQFKHLHITGDYPQEIQDQFTTLPAPVSIAVQGAKVALARLDNPLSAEPLYLRPADVSC